MKEEYVVYKARVKTFQLTILVIMVLVMVIGGTIFGLGVKTRPILRITRPETFHHVKWILDTMIATGLAQLGTAGLDCFATCWKLMWPLYLGIGLTAMTICLELGSIGTSLHLLHSADELANEEIVHPWYWVECEFTGCHSALLNYMYYFVMPQVALSALAIFLQCLAILTMGRMVRTVAEHQKTRSAYKEWYRDHYEERVEAETTTKQDSSKSKNPPTTTTTSGIEMTPMKQEDGDEFGADPDLDLDVLSSPPSQPAPTPPPPSIFNPNCHTPSSILKVDHGYVAASGGSLDDLDSPVKKGKGQGRGGGGGKRKKDSSSSGGTPPSISFKADVQVHYYDQDENILDRKDPDKLD